MDSFYIAGTFLAGTLLVFQLYLILTKRIKIKNKKQGIIKMEDFMNYDMYMIIIGSGVAAGSFLKITENIYEFGFGFLIGLNGLIQGFRQKRCYIIVDASGFKESNFRNLFLYASRRFKWDQITNISMNKENLTKLIFERKAKIYAIEFNSRERIDEFKTQVSTFSPKTYELYLSNV